MSKFKLLRQGERSEGICPGCKGWRETEYRYRTVRLSRSKVDVKDVLVAVCLTCDAVVTIPQQSAPRLREARARGPARIDARVPKELRDLIGMIATELGAEPEPFAGGVLRYYFAELADDQRLARRVTRLSGSPAAMGTPGGRIAFRLERSLLDAAIVSARRIEEGVDQSALVRGVIVAAKEDYFRNPGGRRQSDLRAIALAGG